VKIMLNIRRCFIIEGSDRVWVELVCRNDGLIARVIGREPLYRSRRLSRTFDRYIRRLIGSRGVALEEKMLRGKPRIAGYKRIEDRLYIILEIDSTRLYVPAEKEKLLRQCIKLLHEERID